MAFGGYSTHDMGTLKAEGLNLEAPEGWVFIQILSAALACNRRVGLTRGQLATDDPKRPRSRITFHVLVAP
jgi:hypothetical protein